MSKTKEDELDRLALHYGWTVRERQRVEQYAKQQATMNTEETLPQPDTNWVGAMVKEVMDKAYSQGIDHAIALIEQELLDVDEMSQSAIKLCYRLNRKLKELKKP